MSQAFHSRDFRKVEWFGAHYEFNAQQAACLEVLWRAWLGGTPIIREEQVLQTARMRARSLRDVFKAPPGQQAWGTLIADGDRRGTVRLVEPAAVSPQAEQG